MTGLFARHVLLMITGVAFLEGPSGQEGPHSFSVRSKQGRAYRSSALHYQSLAATLDALAPSAITHSSSGSTLRSTAPSPSFWMSTIGTSRRCRTTTSAMTAPVPHLQRADQRLAVRRVHAAGQAALGQQGCD